MDHLPILSLVTFLPILGVLLIWSIRGEAEVVARNARWVALWTSAFNFVLSLVLWLKFDTSTAAFQFADKLEWMPIVGITYQMGVDGISMLFVLLTTLLTPVCILASWDTIRATSPPSGTHRGASG